MVAEKAKLEKSKQDTLNYIESLKSSNQIFIRKINHKTDENILSYIEDTYLLPLKEIDEIERELKRDQYNN